jgi:2-methylisocitrate lyase-like PEP mutase family enzyme
VLSKDGCELMPGVYDALGARLLAANDFQCAFMSGYGVAASRLGDPDVGLADLTAMTDAGTAVCRAAGAMPVVGDGDAGFGGVANVRRTVLSYHAAGFAAVSIEDQIFPKRCAFSDGMRVVSRAEAVARVAAAVDARDEIRARGGDFMIVARTDARLASDGGGGAFEEAMWRCAAFEDLGADVVYFEGPDGEREMEAFNARVATPFTEAVDADRVRESRVRRGVARPHASERERARGERRDRGDEGGKPRGRRRVAHAVRRAVRGRRVRGALRARREVLPGEVRGVRASSPRTIVI